MSAGIEAWERPLHQPGHGDALVFVVAFGGDVTRLEISADHHRVDHVPDELDLLIQPSSVVQAFLEPPVGDVLREDQPELVELAMASETCLVVRGVIPDPPDLHYVRSIIGIATAALDAGAVAIYHLQSFGLFAADDWRTNIFVPDHPDPKDWVVILSSDSDSDGDDPDGSLWLHTRGLRLFGRPDLSITDVPADDVPAATRLITVLIDQLMRGLVIPDGATMEAAGSLGQVTFHRRGHIDDPDFNNEHFAIDWTPAG